MIATDSLSDRQTDRQVVQFVAYKGILSTNHNESISKSVAKKYLLANEVTHFHFVSKKFLPCWQFANYQEDRKV